MTKQLKNYSLRNRRFFFEPLEARNLMATVAVFDDGRFVDTVGGRDSESETVQASLAALGHTPAPFTGVSAGEFLAGMDGASVLSIPDQEISGFGIAPELTTAAKAQIASFVSSGGLLIVHGDFLGHHATLINAVFGSSTQAGVPYELGVNHKTLEAAGTAFANSADTLPSYNHTMGIVTDSLPANATSIYTRGAETTVALIPVGDGNIVFIGADWNRMTPLGSRDEGWVDVLGAAISLETQGLRASVTNVSPDPRQTAVDQLDFTFSSAVAAGTFSLADVQLTRDGGANLITGAQTLEQLSPTQFRIGGLADITLPEGAYRLQISNTTIADGAGDAGIGVSGEYWIVDRTGPRVLDIVDVSPDPRFDFGTHVVRVTVRLSEPIDESTFDFNDLRLTRDGGPNLITAEQTILPQGGGVYVIETMQNVTFIGGNYVLRVSMADVADPAGNLGTNHAFDSWFSNQQPSISLGGNLKYPQGSRPIAVTAAPQIGDIDTTAFENGLLRVRISQGDATDQLGILNRGHLPNFVGTNGSNVLFQGNVIGTFSGGTGGAPLEIALNANATVPATTALARSISYFSQGLAGSQTRFVHFQLSDGEGSTSFEVFKRVNIVPANVAPTLALNTTSVNYARNAAAILLAPAAVVTDPDSANFANGNLNISITSGLDRRERLEMGGAFTVVGTDVLIGGTSIGRLAATTSGTSGYALIVKFNANATRAVVEELFRSISFRTVGSASNATRTVSMFVRDGQGGLSNTATMNVNLNP